MRFSCVVNASRYSSMASFSRARQTVTFFFRIPRHGYSAPDEVCHGKLFNVEVLDLTVSDVSFGL
jgi:hypothetical protein